MRLVFAYLFIGVLLTVWYNVSVSKECGKSPSWQGKALMTVAWGPLFISTPFVIAYMPLAKDYPGKPSYCLD